MVAFPTDGSSWISIRGSTGEVLSSSALGAGGLSLFGDSSEGRVQIVQDNNATVVQLQSVGSWRLVGSVQWQAGVETLRLQDSTFYSMGSLTQSPPWIVLRSSTRLDQWRAVDVQTGATAWNASGYAIFTDEWITQAGFKSVGTPPVTIHPLNSSWAIVTARALNSSYALLFQHAVLDLSTGQLLGTSVLGPALSATTSFSTDVYWYAASGRIATFFDVDTSYYFAYEAASLQLVCTGPLPAYHELHELETRLSGVSQAGVTLVSRPQQLVGQLYPSTSTERPAHVGEKAVVAVA